MGTKITLTPEAIERLLVADPETALEIKQGIAIEFSKRYLKDLLDYELKQKINEICRKTAEEFRDEFMIKNTNGRGYFLEDSFRKQMEAQMRVHFQEDVQRLCSEFYNQTIVKLNEKIKNTLVDLDTIDNTIINKIADIAADKAHQKLKNLLTANL